VCEDEDVVEGEDRRKEERDPVSNKRGAQSI
jgi:hypothetical protein